MQHKNTENLKKFSLRLRALASRANLAQIEIAKRLDLPASRVGNWFQGKNFPKPQDQVNLAALLNTSVDFLINGTTHRQNSVYYKSKSFVENLIEEAPPPKRNIVDYVLDELPEESLINRFIQIVFDDDRTAEERIEACKLLLPALAKRWPPEKNSTDL